MVVGVLEAWTGRLGDQTERLGGRTGHLGGRFPGMGVLADGFFYLLANTALQNFSFFQIAIDFFLALTCDGVCLATGFIWRLCSLGTAGKHLVAAASTDQTHVKKPTLAQRRPRVGSPIRGGLPGGGFVLVRKEPCSKIKYSGGNMVCV